MDGTMEQPAEVTFNRKDMSITNYIYDYEGFSMHWVAVLRGRTSYPRRIFLNSEKGNVNILRFKVGDIFEIGGAYIHETDPVGYLISYFFITAITEEELSCLNYSTLEDLLKNHPPINGLFI